MRLPRRVILVASLAAVLVMASARPANAATVEEVVAAAGCSTTAVWGLSVQIVDEANCVMPGALADVPDRPNLNKGDAVFPYLQTAARDALVSALDEHSGTTLHVSSMLRTVAQQYLLYRWYQLGLCGIQLAATPGTSNHEQGRALDTSDYGTWDGLFSSYGWDWYGSSDLVHFTYNGAGVVDLAGTDVLAFQRLWNRNHPEDVIDEDGDYGTQTGTRLAQSPADGFPVGAQACCGALDAVGLCDGNTLRWCDGGPQSRDCAAEGLVCGLNQADQTYDCISPCDGIDPTGRCEGHVLLWCDGSPQSRDCAAEGLVCAWAESEQKNACLPEEPPPTDGGADASEDEIDGIPGSAGGCGCNAAASRGSASGVLLMLLFACFGRRRWRSAGRI